jgi:hypothetical protein
MNNTLNTTRAMLALIAGISVSLSACVEEEFVPRERTFTSAELAYDRGNRIEALLATCTGEAKPEADAAAAALNTAGNHLIALVNQNDRDYGGLIGWYDEEKKRLAVYETAQIQAYNAAVACGLAAPGIPDPGSWSSTWWDISSP